MLVSECLYSSGVAEPDRSAAQEVILDTGLPFLSCRNIHQCLADRPLVL